MDVSRGRRIIELLLVPIFAFGNSLLFSLYLFVNGSTGINYTNPSASILTAIFFQCSSLLLLYYVLNRRNETYFNLGVFFVWKDVIAGILLSVAVLSLDYIIQWILIHTLPGSYLHYLYPNNTDFIPTHFSWLFLIFILINPFEEELIVRGFIMREVFSLTQNKTLAVIVSVIFQTSYHLYQGLLPALVLATIFSLYSVYYIKTSRLLPIIIAHLIMDLFAYSSFIH